MARASIVDCMMRAASDHVEPETVHYTVAIEVLLESEIDFRAPAGGCGGSGSECGDHLSPNSLNTRWLHQVIRKSRKRTSKIKFKEEVVRERTQGLQALHS